MAQAVALTWAALEYGKGRTRIAFPVELHFPDPSLFSYEHSLEYIYYNIITRGSLKMSTIRAYIVGLWNEVGGLVLRMSCASTMWIQPKTGHCVAEEGCGWC